MNAATNRDLRDGFEAVQQDMAEHQAQVQGKAPTPEANRVLAAELFTTLEKQWRAAPASIASPAAADPAAPARQTRDVDGREYTVTRDDKVGGAVVPLKRREKQEVVRKLQRLQLLLELPETGPAGAPSYKQRACAVMAHHGNPIRFAFELDALLEASNAHFGDWRADPAKKLIVGA